MEQIFVLVFIIWAQSFAKSYPTIIKTPERWTSTASVVYPKMIQDSLVIVRTSDTSFYIDLQHNGELEGNCHYHGRLLSHEDGRAALSLCGPNNTMSGVILVGAEAFVLRPLEGHPTGSHLLVKVDPSPQDFCAGQHKDAPMDASVNRIRRSSDDDEPKRKVIETAVFVDLPLYRKFTLKKQRTPEQLKDTVLAILNEVQLIYNYQSLKTKFKIAVVKLDILTEGMDSPDAADGDIDEYLDNFCSWQSMQNPPVNSDLHWDHALMLTGYDLHKVTPGNEKNKKVLGLAWVNGMCRPKHSCTINEGSSFEAAFVIAHEIGHSLGMMHDGRGNDCDPAGFLMSEKTGPGRVTWSVCSNHYLDTFFQKGYGSCLGDDNNSYDLEGVENPMDESTLPGKKFGLEDQCKLSLGPEFKPHVVPKAPFNDVCRELWCVSGLWASVAHPALEGSSCGDEKHCIQGSCVEKMKSAALSNAEIVEDMKGAVTDFLDKLKSAFHLLVAPSS